MTQSVSFVGLGYVSIYVEDLANAVTFYDSVFGEHAYQEGENTFGWKIGTTWLTMFGAASGSAKSGNPRGIEFAVQVATAGEVDALYERLIALGAVVCMSPQDTRMYEDMRFACVDDPFGVRIDVYCPSP